MTSADATRLSTDFLEIGALRFEILRAGPDPRNAPTLIFLHEGLGSAREWAALMPPLIEATGCGAVAYSRQGYGASSPVKRPRPLDYLEREAREVLPDILDAVGIGRCILIGHSDGASIAALAAASGDRRIRGAVLIAPHVFVEDVTLAGIAKAKAAFETGRLRDTLESRHDDVDGAFYGWCDAWLDPARRDWSIVAELGRLAVPLAVLQGGSDPYGSTRQAEVVAQNSLAPVDLTILPGIGHFPHREAIEASKDVILRLAHRTLF